MPIPILFVGDAVDAVSGLARITRDLCTVLSSSPRFRVGSLGLGGVGSSRLGWQQYAMPSLAYEPVVALQHALPLAWDDFSQGLPGFLFVVWDLTRLLWLARPDLIADVNPGLHDWLVDARTRKFKLWAYLPIDATGPNDRLTAIARETLLGMDRLLSYTPWSEGVVRRTIGDEAAVARGLTWLPHCYNARTFCPASPQGVPGGGVDALPSTDSGSPVAGLADHTEVTSDDRPTTGEIATRNTQADDHSSRSSGDHGLSQRIDEQAPIGGERDVDARRGTEPTPDQAARQYGHLTDVAGGDPGSGRSSADRAGVGDSQTALVVGVVATNQVRKDWGLVAVVCRALLDKYVVPPQCDCPGGPFPPPVGWEPRPVRLWWHSDVLTRSWSLEALAEDYALTASLEITLAPMTDQELARRYRSCTLTLHPGLGEGHCFPLFESLACDVPALHGNYAGGASMLETCGLGELLVAPSEWRLEGQTNALRPVFSPEAWLTKVREVLDTPRPAGYWSEHVAHLAWSNLAGRWRMWFEEGL